MKHYLSRAEFAERIGVKPDTMSRYKLPEPDVSIGRTRGWSLETIDAWNADRPGKGAGAGRKPRWFNPELAAILDRRGIDMSTVIDATLEVRYEYIWRTKVAWPGGGTYEAELPRNHDDEIVARKATSTVTVEILGRHTEGQMLPVTSGDLERSRVEFVDEGPWVFFDK